MIRNRLTSERDREALIRRSRRRGREGGFFPIWALTSSSVTVYDPAVLSLTGWWRASFSASPWVGTASAGNSGTHNLTEPTTPCSVGTTVNTRTAASFDGTNDQLVGTTSSTYLSVSAYTIVALIKVATSADAASGSPQTDDQVLCDVSSWVGLRLYNDGSNKAAGWHFDSGYKTTAGVAVGTSWAMVAVTFNGTTISTMVNNGSPVTIAATNAGGLAGNLVLGRNGGGGKFTALEILEIMTAQSVLSGANLTDIKSYFNSRYGLSL